MTLRALFSLACLVVLGPVWLSSCTLTATDVEPDLPAVPVNQANTVVYRLNGRPVVAHNYSDFATVVLLPFLGPGAGAAPVRATLQQDSTLAVSCVDAQNVVQPGFVQHGLTWQLPKFRGAGTYRSSPATTQFQLYSRDAADEKWQFGPVQSLAVPNPGAVVVTHWDPIARRIRGTFALRFAAVGTAPAADLTDGQFDVVLSP